MCLRCLPSANHTVEVIEFSLWSLKQMPSQISQNSFSCPSAADHRGSEAVRGSSGAWLEPVVEGLNRPGLRELEALVEQLCGLAMPCSQRNNQENQEQSDSLMQHIQVETPSDLTSVCSLPKCKISHYDAVEHTAVIVTLSVLPAGCNYCSLCTF